jgi:hypothetical protein
MTMTMETGMTTTMTGTEGKPDPRNMELVGWQTHHAKSRSLAFVDSEAVLDTQIDGTSTELTPISRRTFD